MYNFVAEVKENNIHLRFRMRPNRFCDYNNIVTMFTNNVLFRYKFERKSNGFTLYFPRKKLLVLPNLVPNK